MPPLRPHCRGGHFRVARFARLGPEPKIEQMPKLAILTLAAVAVLMAKHAVADFYLQTPYQFLNKGTYGHPGGFLHAGIHAALTPFVYLVLVPGSLLLAVGITLVEFAGHHP